MYFELLANNPHAGDLALRNSATAIEALTPPVLPGPTFLPRTGMWRYHYALDTNYQVECAKKMEIKFDENSKFETVGLPNQEVGQFQGSHPVIIRISCSDCPNPLV